MSLIPGFNIGLEKTAYDLFGGAVRDFGTRALGDLGGDILRQTTGNSEGETVEPFSGKWQSTKYAADLIKYAPKHRFMFKVEFKFDPAYVNELMTGRDNNAFTFLVKSIDRPKVEFVYEDVNYYNFRTKVLKEIRHEPLSMTFIDDIGNNVTSFFNAYRKSFSPISRGNFPTGFSVKTAQINGMNFSDPEMENQADSASRGVLKPGVYNPLQSIIIRQIFAHGTRMCEYTFHNPRISRFDFDEVNHETGEGNGLSVQFDYDALYVSNTLQTNGRTPGPEYAGTDILGNRPGTAKEISTADKVKGTILDSVINAGTRVAGQAVSGAVSSVVKKIPFIGPELAGYAGNMANRVTTAIGRDTLRNAAYGVNNSIAQPSQPVVTSKDNI